MALKCKDCPEFRFKRENNRGLCGQHGFIINENHPACKTGVKLILKQQEIDARVSSVVDKYLKDVK